MMYPYNPAMTCLSDDVERKLAMQAVEEQFRPHPLRALLAWMRKLVQPSRASLGKTAHA